MRTFSYFSSGGECHNPSLGLATKAKGLQSCTLRGKPKSHTACSRECKKVWGNEPSHSQGTSHFGRWSSDGLPNLQKAIAGVKTQCFEEIFIALESSWACITHLDIWNTSYGQKKDRKSNWQFDSRPQKVRN